MDYINPTKFDQAINYQEYQQFMAELVTHTQTEDYSEAFIDYTRMNIIRMERLDKTTKLLPLSKEAIEQIQRPLNWLVLTEPWCGDAAQIIPVLHKLKLLNDHISLGFIMRDKHPELMDAFLTNGARSIPMILIVDPSDNKILGNWGPRPFLAQGMMMRGLNQEAQIEDEEEKRLFHRDLYTKLQKWYARDKTTSIQEEFIDYLKKALG